MPRNSKCYPLFARCRRPLLWPIILFLCLVSGLSQGTSLPCSAFSAFYAGYTEQLDSHNQLVASNNSLRELNNLFGGWTAAGEYVTNVTHFFFQYFLSIRIAELKGIEVIDKKSPFVKSISLKMRNERGDISLLADAVREAKGQAMDAAASFIMEPDSDFRAIFIGISGRNGELSKSKFFVFSEGRYFLEPMSENLLTNMRNILREKFGSLPAFKEYLTRNYGIGISHTDLDSHYGAKLASYNPEQFGGVVTFDLHSIQKQAAHAQDLQTRLSWLFKGKGEPELLEVFKLIRAHALQDVEAIHYPAYQKLLTQKPGADGSAESLLETHLEIKEYMQALNIFDYLPPDSIAVDPLMRKKFNQMRHPSGVLFLDIRQVGARNLLRLHHLVAPVIEHLNTLEKDFLQLKDMELRGAPIEKEKSHITQTYLDIVRMRQEVFRETGAFLNEKREAITRVFREHGFSDEQFAIWASGDDIFVLFRQGEHPIDSEILAISLKNVSALSTDARVGFMHFDVPRAAFPLDRARASLGKTSEPLKFSEKLDLGYEVIAEYQERGSKKVVIFSRVEGNRLTPIPESDLNLLRLGLKDWQVLNHSE